MAARCSARVGVEGRPTSSWPSRASACGAWSSAGFRALARSPRPRLLVGLAAAQAFVRGCLNVLIVVWSSACSTAGGRGRLPDRRHGSRRPDRRDRGDDAGARRLAVVFGLALVFWGLPIALMAPVPYFATALFLLAVIGAANSRRGRRRDHAAPADCSRRAPHARSGRRLGARHGRSRASARSPRRRSWKPWAPRSAFVAVGLILPVLTLATYRRLVEIDRGGRPGPELELIERVPMFAPLSIAAKERIAGKLVPVSVAAGGARDPDGRRRRPLLHRRRRRARRRRRRPALDDGRGATTSARSRCSATCRGRRPSPRRRLALYALERDAFLEAVTGHAVAHAAGQEVAEARLARVGAQREL